MDGPTFERAVKLYESKKVIEFETDEFGFSAKVDSGCIKTFQVLENRETCFGWEEPLVKITNLVDRCSDR